MARLLVLLLLLGAAPSCTVRARARPAYVVDVAPPAPRRVYVQPRRGYVWIDGYWQRIGGRWVWQDGYWERERRGQVWAPGVWIDVGGRYEWRPGRWERRDRRDRPRPRVRDHRQW